MITLKNILKSGIRLLFIFVTAIHYSGSACGQETTTTNSDSSVVITKDSQLDQLITKQKRQNLTNQTMRGFRIQIYFGGVRQKASEVKLEFSNQFTDIAAYITYQQPNFKVRVGDFRSRIEAQKFQRDIEGLFPSSFIVPDDVRLPPLK